MAHKTKSWTPLTTLFAVVSGLLAASLIVVAGMSFARQTEPSAVSHWVEPLPPGHQLDLSLFQRPFAVSPDGNWLAYVARDSEGSQLFLRSMNEHQAVAVPNTYGVGNPFFSPDGQWLAFFADGKLRKVSTGGGSPLDICEESAINLGAHWGTNDTILYARVPDGIFRVAANGGTPEHLTEPNAAAGEVLHHWPQALPDGKTVLFSVNTTPALLDLETRRWETINSLGETNTIRYLPSGFLLFEQGNMLRSVRFDPTTLEVVGTPRVVGDSIQVPGTAETMYLDVSHTGLLVFLQWDAADKTLVWVDRMGEVTPLPIDAGPFYRPQLSPVGSRAVVTQRQERGLGWDISVHDISQGRPTRLPVRETAFEPIWTLDGERITFCFGAGAKSIGWMRADGVGGLDTLRSGNDARWHHSWSPDGILAVYGITERGDRDIWLLRVPGDGELQLLITTEANERSPTFSPDGRWLAYVSDETGRDEIYVYPFPNMESRYVISTRGGRDPVWSRDGRELFFRSGNKMMVSEITTRPTFSAATTRVLFSGQFETEPAISGSHSYDVSPDGRRFMMVQSEPVTEIRVVLDWSVEAERER